MRLLFRHFAMLVGALCSVWAFGATRSIGESASTFATRLTPAGAELVHHPIEAKPWAGRAAPILAFYEQDVAAPATERTGARSIRGVLYVPAGKGSFEPVDVATYEPEGGNPHIESVFFATVRGLSRPALFILVSWNQNHALVKGKLYSTYAYALAEGGQPVGVRFLEKLSAKLDGGCDCWRDGEPSSKAKFKNAAAIKAALAGLSAQ